MNKNYFLTSFILVLTFFTFSCETESIDEIALQSVQNKKDTQKDKCTSIQSGDINYPDTHYIKEAISTGFDIYGYNYQAHIYKGNYANLYLGGAGYPPFEGDDDYFIEHDELITPGSWFMTHYYPYRNDEVNMTWNDAWQPNKDCDGDGFLDVISSSDAVGTGGWENFHRKGTYVNAEGQNCQWQQHTKIVALPENARLDEDGFWYDSNGNQIGEDFWGVWAKIQTVLYDPCGEMNEFEEYLSPFRAGFGNR